MRIAIVKLSALGDIIHAMIVLQYIKKYNPSIKIDWIVEKSYKNLLEFNPDINKVYTVNIKNAKKNKSIYSFLKELRKVSKLEQYDLVIDMQGLIKSALVARLVPSKLTAGFDKASARESLASIFYNKKINFPYEKNIILKNIALIESVLIKTKTENVQSKVPFLYSSKKYFFDCISSINDNILIVLGASYNAKVYPIEKLQEVIKKIDANFIIIWGSKTEKYLAELLKESAPESSITSKLSLDALASLISQMDLVIGPDTGPTHMAWALNIPSITLFGPTPGYRNTLITSINKIIESDSYVNPNKINKKDYSIKTIKTSDIVNMANYLIGSKK
tara:strand:- start:815 stop:1816 length:1002 start_codon:yes stop_codon:yes gene_type:complete